MCGRAWRGRLAVEEGVVTAPQAKKRQHRSRYKMCCIILILIAAVVIICLVVAIVMGVFGGFS